MEDKIDRLGKCPNCGSSWDGGDMYLHIALMAINTGKKEGELKAMAGSYGWTEFNQTHFSTLVSHELPDGRNLLECPNMRCMHVFDRYTGQEYLNMRKARNNEPINVFNVEKLQEQIEKVESIDNLITKSLKETHE